MALDSLPHFSAQLFHSQTELLLSLNQELILSSMEEDGMEVDSAPCQSSPENPWPETDHTVEEQIQCLPGERVSRVLHLFEFRKNGVPVTLPIGQTKYAYKGIEVVGIVGALLGKTGLFAQCAWFGNYDCDWFWCLITDIRAVEFRSDIRFRGGSPCIWISSPRGDYALLVPRPTYADMWEASLHSYGPHAREARVGVWPTQGTRPSWWDRRWQEDWPWEKDSEPMNVDGSDRGWPRLGPRGDLRFPGEPLSHLHVLSPWVISPNGLTLTKRE